MRNIEDMIVLVLQNDESLYFATRNMSADAIHDIVAGVMGDDPISREVLACTDWSEIAREMQEDDENEDENEDEDEDEDEDENEDENEDDGESDGGR